jgi:hypothetical protein
VAVEPLFAASMAALKTALRVSAATNAGAVATIDQAVKDARLTFYRKLGASRITTIKATNDIDAPTTDAEITRSLATSVELRLVRVLLIRRLSTMFVDASGHRQLKWNEEAGFLASNPVPTTAELDRLEAEIDADMQALDDGDLDEATFNVSSLGPDVTPDLPGASIWPGLRLSEQDEDE